MNVLSELKYGLGFPPEIEKYSIKKGFIRANQKDFMGKELYQTIIVRSKLLNKFLRQSSWCLSSW